MGIDKFRRQTEVLGEINAQMGVRSRGVPLFSAGVPMTTGNTYHVDSGHSAATDTSNTGTNPAKPLATIDAAIGKCTASNGDLILVAPGHAETLSTAGAITMDVIGVTIVGMGEGSLRPTLTFGALTSASVVISAASCSIYNIVCVCGLDGMANPIHVQAADCTLDIEWRDGSATVEAARAVLTTAPADRFRCRLKYLGFVAGNAGVNAIRLVGCNDAIIDVDYYGICTTGVVEFATTACSNVAVYGRFHVSGTSLTLNVVDTITGSTWTAQGYDGVAGSSFSGGDAAALAGDDVSAISAAIGTPVNTGGTATIAGIMGDPSNVSFATSLAKLGTIANTGGTATLGGALGDVANVDVATRLGNIDSDTAKIDSATLAVAPTAGSFATYVATGGTALGTPLADSKSLVDALGTNGTTVADAAGSVLGAIGADNADNAFASTAVVANVDGSVLERQEWVQAQIGTIANTGGTATLGGALGDVANVDVATRLGNIDSDTAKIDSATLAVAPAAGSLASFVVSGGTAHGTPLADSKSLCDALGTNGTTVADAAGSVLGAIGADNADNAFASTAVLANADGSVLERLEYMQIETDKLDTSSLAVAPAAGSMARYFASGGTALGTELADSKSLVDVLGSDGTTVTDAAASVLGAIGADNANNAFASTNVVANADGSVLERQEWVQAQIGTLLNTGGTADLASIIGDFANTDLEQRLTNIYEAVGGDTGFPGVNQLLGRRVDRAAADIIDGTTRAVFTVSNGKVMITQLTGTISAFAVDAGASSINFVGNPTTGSTTNLCAVIDPDADEVGTLYALDGVIANPPARSKSGGVPAMGPKGIIVSPGTIDFVSTVDRGTGGALLELQLWYIPLDDGGTVVTA